ncbi:MAG TPA: DUF192 domain-containing protein [Candidatus Altiarchaeales archaeon]|nr:DUF192 domain-containing protein [Candidatus Altiarchaeales archaeon]
MNAKVRPLIIVLGLVLVFFIFRNSGADYEVLCFECRDCVKAEVMKSEFSRAKGLMYREELARDEGAFFIFENTGAHGMWMRNMNFPIDIIWFDESLRVVFVHEDVPACRTAECPTYRTGVPARYALEVNAGYVKEHEISEGVKLS